MSATDQLTDYQQLELEAAAFRHMLKHLELLLLLNLYMMHIGKKILL
jgi:hypothetical protein